VTNETIKAVLGAALAAMAIACGPQSNSSSADTLRNTGRSTVRGPQVEPMPHEPCVGSGGEETRLSVGEDRPVPVIEVRRNGRLYCRATDANFDGRVDITRFFDEQGRVRRVEDDFDFDGKLDAVAIYRDGIIVSDILDTNFDGRTDTWREYEGGRLVRLQRDSNSDGIIDMWEDFDERGNVIRTRVDANRDGQPDEEPDAGAIAAPTTSSIVTNAASTADSSVPGAASAADAGGQG
jgi:hypothetical protein